jgi:rhamnulose-1-phosphate aldolase
MAGHLSSRGWAEASAGNISVLLGPSRSRPGGTAEFPLQIPVPELDGRLLAVTRSGCRLRKLAADPEEGVLLLRVTRCGRSLCGSASGGRPTVEVSSHMLGHLAAARAGAGTSALIHVHPPSILALSACRNSSRRLEAQIRRAHPEVNLLLGGAIRFIDYLPPGTPELAASTGRAFTTGARAVIWRGHGAAGLGGSLDEACDAVEIVEAAAGLMIRRASFMGRFGSYSPTVRRDSKGGL